MQYGVPVFSRPAVRWSGWSGPHLLHPSCAYFTSKAWIPFHGAPFGVLNLETGRPLEMGASVQLPVPRVPFCGGGGVGWVAIPTEREACAGARFPAQARSRRAAAFRVALGRAGRGFTGLPGGCRPGRQ